MRIYTVHILPRTDALDHPPVFLREGFCWPAAILSALWALWHGMWLVALLLLLAGAGLGYGLELAGADWLARGIGLAAFALVVGHAGNDWRRARLARLGYRTEGVVAAPGFDAAQRRWFDLHPPGRTHAASVY